MKILLIPILLTPFTLWSQTFVQDISALNTKVGQDQLDAYLKAPTKAGVPGPFFNSLVPHPTLNAETLCTEEDEKKKSQYEVVLIAEGNAQFTSTEILPGQKAQLHTNDLKWLMNAIPENESSKGLALDPVTQRATDIWNSGWITTPSTAYDPKSPLGQELFVESLVRAAAKSDKNENDLARELASVIGQTYKTDQEKYSVLAAFSLRLYRNYNTARNPGYDNPKNNPFDAELPAGDINLNGMLKAAADFNVFQGGVCNDITESVIQVGEHLFPGKDVLAVNSGTHFGVLIADGKTTHIIDGGDEMVLTNNLKLDPKMSPTNLRISKMENGALREIAVVDTEMGQLVEGAFQTGKHLLKTDADISSIYAHLKKNNFGVTVGTGKLSDSNVVIVVAKYETVSDKWKTNIGIGGTAQTFNGDEMKTKYQVHFRAGVERSLFRYINDNTALNFSTGARANFMYLLNPQNEGGGAQKVDMSAGLDWYNRFDLAYGNSNPNGVKLKTYVEVEHTVGPSNWGNTTGAMSYMQPKDTGTMFKNMTFHLNQVNADVMAEKKVGTNTTGFVQTHYQGSNIGQSVSVLGGLNINAPNGAQILVFTGYTKADIGGFKTQNSLLSQQTGPQIGAKYTTKTGIEFGAGARSVAGKPAVQATIKIPLGKKK
jgi:hypothetical protein